MPKQTHHIRLILIVVLTFACLAGFAPPVAAQSTPPEKDWKFTLYPVLAWVPLTIDIDVNVPPIAGGGGGGGASGQIVDGRFDGAFFGGASATNGIWRIEGYGMWAAVGGDRPERPFLVVDVDILYGDAKIGRRIAPDLFVTGGVRRLAFEYDVTIADLPRLGRKPGFWDPVIGIGWHRIGPRVEWHASIDGGGFGVGSDVDLGASVRVDWKVLRVFGLTAGYNYLYLKVSDTVAGREVTLEPTFHGPVAGLGFYF
jgi:hypothetical protein